eukprot:Skav201510  [mRNA]  locus=scaffold1154:403000:409629:+ [translate_table: standard]
MFWRPGLVLFLAIKYSSGGTSVDLVVRLSQFADIFHPAQIGWFSAFIVLLLLLAILLNAVLKLHSQMCKSIASTAEQAQKARCQIRARGGGAEPSPERSPSPRRSPSSFHNQASPLSSPPPRRSTGYDQSPTAQSSPSASSCGQPSPASSGRVQTGIGRFFNSPKAYHAVKLDISQPFKKPKLSKFTEDAINEKNEWILKHAQLEAQIAANKQDRIEIANRTKELVKRNRRSTRSTPTSESKSNRKLPGSPLQRLEISSAKKLEYATQMLAARGDFANLQDYWRAQCRRYGLPKRSLQHILFHKDHWQKLVSQPPIGSNVKSKKPRIRAQGGGRKVPFPQIISDLRTWLSLERTLGHTISKADLCTEFCARLQLKANQLRHKASQKDVEPLQQGMWLSEAEAMELKKHSIQSKKKCRDKIKTQLVRWIGAKYMATELVSTISQTEAQTRCLLTWQGFDHTLWLATCASEKTLRKAKRISDPESFIANRKHLVIGFSDQVPLWAKATGRKAVFSGEEIHHSSVRRDFSGVRTAIEEIMASDGPPEFEVQPLARKRKSPCESVVRKLSFDSAAENESPDLQMQSQPVDSTEHETSEPEASSAAAVVPSTLEPEEEAPKPKAKAKRITGKQAVPSEHQPAVPEVGSRTLIDETFSVGDKTITRKKGESAGKILLPYRRLRKEHPDLVGEVDIMSQPAANVDSVILTWVIQRQAEEYPCSVWMRDCFSSVFADSTTEALALANQLSCLVAEKCTSKLQITDTDFSKQFKSLVKSKLTELRSEWQSSAQEDHAFWKIGPFEIVSSVVYAQRYMQKKNYDDSWVLRAAIRNGILAYRPNPETQKLEPILDQEWAQEFNEMLPSLALGFGSKRFDPNWLSDRYKWLDTEGVPSEPNWGLSAVAKHISDLQVWDYYHPEEDDEANTSVELEGDFDETLKLDLENSLSLRLHPSLRRSALRRLASLEYKEKYKKEVAKKNLREYRAQWRRKHRSKLVQALVEKVKSQSRAEALEEVQPQVKPKKVAKLSKAFKPSAKSKSNLKSKPSAKAKVAKKQAVKALADKELSKPDQKLPEEPPPLCAPEHAPSDDPWIGEEVVVTSEAASARCFGKSGTLISFDSKTGWCLLSWWLQKKKKTSFDELSIRCLDPILGKLLLLQEHTPQDIQRFEESITAFFTSDTQLLLVPVYAAYHWTLLVAERHDSEITWRRYDTLSQEHAESHDIQVRLGKLIDPKFELPPLSNTVTQKVGSNLCGCYVLHYMEQEIRSKMGEWPSVWPSDGWKTWKDRLMTMVEKLQKEYEACQTALEDELKKIRSEQAERKKHLEKAQEKLKTVCEHQVTIHVLQPRSSISAILASLLAIVCSASASAMAKREDLIPEWGCFGFLAQQWTQPRFLPAYETLSVEVEYKAQPLDGEEHLVPPPFSDPTQAQDKGKGKSGKGGFSGKVSEHECPESGLWSTQWTESFGQMCQSAKVSVKFQALKPQKKRKRTTEGKSDSDKEPSEKYIAWTSKDLKLILSEMNCNPQDQNYILSDDHNYHPVLSCEKHIAELEDQHLWLGWCLLSSWLQKKKTSFDVLSIRCLDPVLGKLLLLQELSPQDIQRFEESITAFFTSDTQLLLVPVYAAYHWTLLVAERHDSEITWRRYDTLSQEHAESHDIQVRLGKLIDPKFELPPLSNTVTQSVGSRLCGCYVLHYMEQEIRSKMGEWPGVWPSDGWKTWKDRLMTMAEKLQKEYEACRTALEDELKQIRSQQAEAKEQLEKAQEAINKNSVKFTWKDLDESSVARVLKLRGALGKCAKCRWQSGCLDCSAWHRLRYELKESAKFQGKIAFLSQGPEDLEQLFQSEDKKC